MRAKISKAYSILRLNAVTDDDAEPNNGLSLFQFCIIIINFTDVFQLGFRTLAAYDSI